MATKLAKKTEPATKVGIVKSLELDQILGTATTIENMEENQAIKAIPELMENIEFNFFQVGGIMSLIRAKGWLYGEDNFEALVVKRFDMGYRKALILIEIYDFLVTNQITWDRCKGVGWTKLRFMSKTKYQLVVLKEFDEWIERAKVSSTIQLEAMLDQALEQKDAEIPVPDGLTPTNEGEGETRPVQVLESTLSAMTFKVHADQKNTIKEAVNKAKESTGTEADSVALETICIGYLGGSIELPEGSIPTEDMLKRAMQAFGVDKVIETFEDIWPEITLEVTEPTEEPQV